MAYFRAVGATLAGSLAEGRKARSGIVLGASGRSIEEESPTGAALIAEELAAFVNAGGAVASSATNCGAGAVVCAGAVEAHSAPVIATVARRSRVLRCPKEFMSEPSNLFGGVCA